MHSCVDIYMSLLEAENFRVQEYHDKTQTSKVDMASWSAFMP